VLLERTDLGRNRASAPADPVPAQPEQRPYAVVHIFVGGHQLFEVAEVVQTLLVVADAGLDQRAGNTVLHLHHTLGDQAAITQRPAPVADRCRGHVALGQEVAAQPVGDLADIDAVVCPLRRRNGPKQQGDARPSLSRRKEADGHRSTR
jgi:hypothetical protein